MQYKILFFLLFAMALSCKKDSNAHLPNHISQLIKEYEKEKSQKSGNKLLSAILAEIQKDGEAPEVLYETAVLYADKMKNTNFKFAALQGLVRDHFDSPKTADRIAQIIEMTNDDPRKNQAGLVLKRGFIASFPKDKRAKEYETSLPDYARNIDTLMSHFNRQIIDQNSGNFNPKMAREYVNAAEAIALSYPAFERSVSYLFNAAKTANIIRDYTKSISLYQWIIKKFPNHKLAAKSLFMIGFTYDTNLHNDKKAKTFYEKYLEQFPNDDLVKDAQILLNNLGLSEEELLKKIQENQKK